MIEQLSPVSGMYPFFGMAGWLVASLIYRLSRGKPILFFTVPGASYLERFASGNSNRHWYTRFGGANNCLVVAIVRGKLVVRPWFPFNLMFLPEIFGIEEEIPLERIQSVQVTKKFFTRRVRVDYRNVDRESQSLTLLLKKPDEFLANLPATIQVIGPEKKNS